jgi:hypothetical protein
MSMRDDFERGAKGVTLMGMSGVGKTHWAWAFEKAGFYHYNCDYLIGVLLKDELIKADCGEVALDDLDPLSNFIGQVGKDKLSLEEFKRRQKLYIEAEAQVLRDMRVAMQKHDKPFVNDATGSLCEIDDPALYAQLAQDTVFVYIKAGPEHEAALVEQAKLEPKPLYFPAKEFDAWLAEYMAEKNVAAVDEMDPNDFSAWVFPRLFRSRLPKYEALARQYGVVIAADDARRMKTVEDFLSAIEHE